MKYYLERNTIKTIRNESVNSSRFGGSFKSKNSMYRKNRDISKKYAVMPATGGARISKDYKINDLAGLEIQGDIKEEEGEHEEDEEAEVVDLKAEGGVGC